MARVFSLTNRFYHPANNTNANFSSLSKKGQYLLYLNLCSSMKQLQQIHAQILISDLMQDRFLVSEVLRFSALSPTGNLDYARTLLYHAIDPLPSSWNHVIRGFSQRDSPVEAIMVYLKMKRQGVESTMLTFPFVLKACSRISAIEEGKQVQADIVKIGLDSDVYILNTLISLYGSCKKTSEARKVFDNMPNRTIISWNAILTAYTEVLSFDECIDIFYNMRFHGFEPDATTMLVMLSACSELGKLCLGKLLHSSVIQRRLSINVQLGTSLIDMYAKCGDIEFAHRVFDQMYDRNVWTWSALIVGLAQHGLARESLDLFEKMKKSSLRPNHVTFLGVLCACSHAGIVDKGRQYFNEMVNIYGIEPVMSHYSVMVSILGRSGRLIEAYDFINNMPVEPEAIVWRTLLTASAIHDVNDCYGIAEKVRKKLLLTEPRRSGNYVIVANMYAEIGLWEEVARVRKIMREGGLRKVAAESWIEVSGVVHRFLSGDDCHVEGENIYDLLDRLNLHMKINECVNEYPFSCSECWSF